MGGCASKPNDASFLSENPPVQKLAEDPVNATEEVAAPEKVTDVSPPLKSSCNTVSCVLDYASQEKDDKENTKEASLNASEPQEIQSLSGETNADANHGVSEKDESNLIDFQDSVTLIDPMIVDGETESNKQMKDKNEAAVNLINNFETKSSESRDEDKQPIKILENDDPAKENPSNSEIVKDLPSTGKTEPLKNLASAGVNEPVTLISA